MPAVAEKVRDYNKTTKTKRTRRVHRAVRTRPRAAKTMFGLICGVLLFLVFAYAAYAANSLVQGRRYSQLIAQQRQEKNRCDRLSARLNALKSPDKVIAAASKCGMVYAKEYDYVGKAGRVASSAQ